MFYSLEKTAELLELTPGDVNRLREQGKLHGYRDGAAWKFRKEDVENYLTKMIKERSAGADDLLSTENDEEGPTMLADSSAFDAMIDNAVDGVKVTAGESGLSLAKEDDDLKLADEDDDFKLADDNDDDLKLAEESTPLTDSASALVDDAPAAKSASAVDLTKSDDDLLHLDGDSGLALLDEPNVDGSNVSLGDDDDLVLGGGSSTGSGSGLDLSGDSGLALLGESDDDFQLDESASEKIEEEPKEEAADDGIFELADDTTNNSPVLNLDKEADSDAPTELGVAADDSIFDLSDTSQKTEDADASTSVSASQMINVENDPFTTDDESSTAAKDKDNSLFDASDVLPDPFTTTTDSTPASTPSTPASTPFESQSVDSDPFANSAPIDSTSAGFGDNPFGDPSTTSDTFVDPSTTSGPITDSTPTEEPGATVAPVASTNFVGKDMLFLVPCLILLILATIGAWELCRTIWSYQEGTFDFGGPVLETIAKMVKLI